MMHQTAERLRMDMLGQHANVKPDTGTLKMPPAVSGVFGFELPKSVGEFVPYQVLRDFGFDPFSQATLRQLNKRLKVLGNEEQKPREVTLCGPNTENCTLREATNRLKSRNLTLPDPATAALAAVMFLAQNKLDEIGDRIGAEFEKILIRTDNPAWSVSLDLKNEKIHFCHVSDEYSASTIYSAGVPLASRSWVEYARSFFAGR